MNLIDVLQGVFIHAVVDQVDRLVLCILALFENLFGKYLNSILHQNRLSSPSLQISLRMKNQTRRDKFHLLTHILLFCDHLHSFLGCAFHLSQRLFIIASNWLA